MRCRSTKIAIAGWVIGAALGVSPLVGQETTEWDRIAIEEGFVMGDMSLAEIEEVVPIFSISFGCMIKEPTVHGTKERFEEIYLERMVNRLSRKSVPVAEMGSAGKNTLTLSFRVSEVFECRDDHVTIMAYGDGYQMVRLNRDLGTYALASTWDWGPRTKTTKSIPNWSLEVSEMLSDFLNEFIIDYWKAN